MGLLPAVSTRLHQCLGLRKLGKYVLHQCPEDSDYPVPLQGSLVTQATSYPPHFNPMGVSCHRKSDLSGLAHKAISDSQNVNGTLIKTHLQYWESTLHSLPALTFFSTKADKTWPSRSSSDLCPGRFPQMEVCQIRLQVPEGQNTCYNFQSQCLSMCSLKRRRRPPEVLTPVCSGLTRALSHVW